MRHRVFISHCEEDHAVALDVCHRIERRGVKCWIAPRDVVVGEDYLARIGDAIEGSAAFVVVLSRHTNRSRFVKVEAEFAFSDGMTIFPVRIEDVKIERGLRLLVSINHRVDAFGADRAARLEQFADAVVRNVLSGNRKGGGSHELPAGAGVLMSAIGAGASDFIAQWRAMDARGSRIAWSWEAALGGPLWPFYRGMVLAGVGCAVLLALMIVIGGAQGGARGALSGLLVGWAVLAVLVGLTGSAALRRHIGDAIRYDRAPSPILRAAGLAASAAAVAGAFAATLPRGTPPAAPFSSPTFSKYNLTGSVAVNRPRRDGSDAMAEPDGATDDQPGNDIENIVRNILVEQQQQNELNAAAAATPIVSTNDTMPNVGNAM